MKEHLHLFVVFTLLQIAFSALYYGLVRRIDATILISMLLYTAAMTTNYFGYRRTLYQKRRKEMIDALP